MLPLVITLHAAFVAFVVFGGFLVLRWRRLAWVHAPAALWGVFVEYSGWICPLTPLENYWRRRAGAEPYAGDFIEHYILPVLYPAELTRATQIVLGSLALALNLWIYWKVFRTSKRR